jgi:Sulfotransferase family
MVRESFNRHPLAWIVRETHYFDDLRPRLRNRGRAPLEADEVGAVERYFLSLGHRAYGADTDVDQSVVPRELLHERAAAIGGGGDAYFEAFCRIRAEQNGRQLWGEKTPRHAFRIAEMLAAFPSAHIVCLIRDPRAVVASYRDWTRRPALDPTAGGPFAGDRRRARSSYNVVLASLLCKAALRAALQARARFGPERVRLLVYEELVAKPELVLTELTSWLGLSYDPSMLEVPLVQSSYAADGGGGISTAPLQRWRSKLAPAEVRVIESSCAGLMRELGYNLERPRCSPLTLSAAWLSAIPGVARAAFANRRRLGRAGRYVGARVRLALGS